jgi:stage II sporulation protein D
MRKLLPLLLAICPFVVGKDLRIGVFGLFRPTELILSATPGDSLRITAGSTEFTVEGKRTARFLVDGQSVQCSVGDRIARSSVMHIGGGHPETDFVLSVPGKIQRRFRGAAEIRASAGALIPILVTDLEIAVASALAAETAAGTPVEALKAQAIAIRSYYVAGPARHEGYDFCDTTHCQFMKAAPEKTSATALATAETRGLILTYEGSPLEALFSASCGGRTRTLAEAGMQAGPYPYYAVECEACRRRAPVWTRSISAQFADLVLNHSESHRLELGRIFGWSMLPGNTYAAVRHGDVITVQGRGEGHGVGLCQLGAKAMATGGVHHREILNHYYPNTVLSLGK